MRYSGVLKFTRLNNILDFLLSGILHQYKTVLAALVVVAD